MVIKLKEFAAKEHLRAVGHSKCYIFKHDLLAEAGVKPSDEFRVLVSVRKILLECPKHSRARAIVPRPLSFYLKRRVKAKAPVSISEVWPDVAPHGNERIT